jgi:hypothetical protein
MLAPMMIVIHIKMVMIFLKIAVMAKLDVGCRCGLDKRRLKENAEI